MSSSLAVFHYEQQQVRTVERKGEPWFVLADLCKVLSIDHVIDTAKRLDEDEVGQTEVIDRMGRKQRAYIVNESGLYSVILRSDKPQAKPFRKWVTSEVLPQIRRTGAYAMGGGTKQNETLRQRNTAVREQNAKIRTAQVLLRIAERTETEYKKVLHARITHLLTGEYLLPLPKVNERTYSAAEIGERLGVSANKIGRIANAHGMKTEKYGKYFYDKAKTADKQVETFRYYESAVTVFRSLLEVEA